MKILAFIYKQAMLNLSSPADLCWLLVYPFVGLLSVGVLSLHLEGQGVGKEFIYFVMVGTLSWDFLNLAQKATTHAVLYDLWANCLRYTFLAPIKLKDFVVGNALFGLASAIIGFFLTQIIAHLVFDFTLFGAGWILIPSAISIWLFATAVGLLINGVVLEKGYEYSFLAWATVGLIMVLSGVYYPVDILPAVVRRVSYLLPTTHVIISLRGILLEGVVLSDAILKGLGLSSLYAILSFFYLGHAVKESKKKSLLSDW